MATCDWCNLDMLAPETTTCVQSVKYPDGVVVDAIPYTHWGGHWTPNGRSSRGEIPDGHRCHDCRIVKGGLHHPGCDMERCPRCEGQLISCGCLSEGEEGDE
jgi:hypothetical protein